MRRALKHWRAPRLGTLQLIDYSCIFSPDLSRWRRSSWRRAYSGCRIRCERRLARICRAASRAGHASTTAPSSRHPTRLEDGVPVARRSFRLWAADNHLQPLQSLVPEPHLAAHLREDGGRRSGSRRTFHRQQSRQSASLSEWLKKGELRPGLVSFMDCLRFRCFRQTGLCPRPRPV
jgi:hypothetical protein